MPTLAGNKHLSVHFLPHGPGLSHHPTGKSTVRSVRNGHQSGYSRDDIINKDINKRSKDVSIQGISAIIQSEDNLKYRKLRVTV